MDRALVMSAMAVAIRVTVIGSSARAEGIVVPGCTLMRVGCVVIIAVVVRVIIAVVARAVIAVQALDLGCFSFVLCRAVTFSPAEDAGVARRSVFQFLVCRGRAV